MLILSRYRDESIMIDDVVLTIVSIRGEEVRLGIDAPRGIPIHPQQVVRANTPRCRHAAPAQRAWHWEEQPTLARFICSQSPEVEAVLDAIREKFKLGLGTIPVKKLVKRIYQQLACSKILYDLEPCSFGLVQEIRPPSAILRKTDPRVATCLDSSLLMAACLEAAGAQSLVFQFVQGASAHAIAGAWVVPPTRRAVVYRDSRPFNLTQPKNAVAVETTGITINRREPYGQAKRAAQRLFEDPRWSLRFALDVAEARRRDLLPWPSDD